uniref:Uncharacterized protein n=1 Tax=Romanomermis culicivorax TaxID=13658 RepID=A0A915K7S2_ROMCU
MNSIIHQKMRVMITPSFLTPVILKGPKTS